MLWFSVGGVLAGLVFSGSVSGMLCAITGALTALLLQPRGKRALGFLLIVGTGVSLLVFSFYQQATLGIDPLSRFYSATGQTSDTNTLALRLLTDEMGWEGIQRSPIVGVGLDIESGGVVLIGTQVHNIFLLYWLQGGILLLFALMIVLMASGGQLWRAEHSPTKTLLIASTLTALLYAQTAPIMFQRYFWLPFILAAAWGGLATANPGRRPAAQLVVRKSARL